MRYDIKQMSREHVDVAVQWAASEGWNPGIDDAEVFYQADPDGYFMAVCSNGEMIGAVSAVAYGDNFGFIGFFIVRPDWRGKLVGVKLGRQALWYLRDRNIGVDGVEDKVEKYSEFGFKLAYHNYRYAGKVPNVQYNCPYQIRPYSPIYLDGIRQYDRLCFPASRDHFLDGWLTMPHAKTLVFDDGGDIRGFGTIRRCIKGYKIGPLFADDTAVADELLRALQNKVRPGDDFYWDIPGPNEPAIKMAEDAGMEVVFGTARMYTRGEPDIDLGRIFGVTTFELG